MKHKDTNPRGKRLLLCGCTAAAGALIAWGAAAARGLKPGIGTAMTLRFWSDGCFVSAVLIGGLGALIWISTTGIFDIFKYGFSSLLVLFTPFRKPKDQMSFYDYKTYQAEKRKPARPELLAVGAFFLILSVLLLAAYSSAGGGPEG